MIQAWLPPGGVSYRRSLGTLNKQVERSSCVRFRGRACVIFRVFPFRDCTAFFVLHARHFFAVIFVYALWLGHIRLDHCLLFVPLLTAVFYVSPLLVAALFPFFCVRVRELIAT